MPLNKKKKPINSKAALNTIVVESQPFYYYGGEGSILPYGTDNLYPQRMEKAGEDSPTLQGCFKKMKYFIKGYGFENGSFKVNRENETLNDILDQCVDDYVKFEGFALHFNFNLLGRITEIFNIPIEFLRKNRDLQSVQMGIWDTRDYFYTYYNHITFDLYGKCDPVQKMLYGNYKDYKGQVLYYCKSGRIYPNATAQPCVLSGEYEREVQLYSYANVTNSFSANNVIKMPTISAGEESQHEVDSLQAEVRKLHGSGNAGASVVVPIAVDAEGKVSDFKMVENLTPTSVDNLFVNQNQSAERTILKTFGMPEILLGVSSSGMFNESSYNDAFNYKNADTEQDRKSVERVFNEFLPNSVFGIDSVEIQPLSMKKTEL